MGRFKKLVRKIEQWVEVKKILEKGATTAQMEETEEIKIAILNNNKTEIIGGIGDALMALIIQAKMRGVNLLDCLEDTCGGISKQRKRMIDGITVRNTPIPVILYKNDYVIIKEDGDFARSESGQIVIYGDWLDGTKELKCGEVLKSCSILTDVQKEILKENIRIFQQ